MSNWSDYKPEGSTQIEAGNHRVVVTAVEETTSKTSGNPMLVITVQPNGSKINIKNYIVKNEYFNRNITQFFDSFGIERGDFNLESWVGAVGAAKLAEDENGYLKVKWFLSPKQAADLPEWKGEQPKRQTVGGFTLVAPTDDLPF